MSILADLNTVETRAEVVRARHDLYSRYTQPRVATFLCAADKHYRRRVAQSRAILVLLFLAGIVAFGVTAYGYIAGTGVGMFVMAAPVVSVACMVIVGSVLRRAVAGNAHDALETVRDAHMLHQARQRNT